MTTFSTCSTTGTTSWVEFWAIGAAVGVATGAKGAANGVAVGKVFATTLFLTSGTLTISFFAYPVVGSVVVTSLATYSTTGTTSWVEF